MMNPQICLSIKAVLNDEGIAESAVVDEWPLLLQLRPDALT